MEVDVEVLDVTDAEARELLSIDPLAQLAQMQSQLYDRLRETTPTTTPSCAPCGRRRPPRHFMVRPQDVPAQFLVLLTCRDEKHQVELIARSRAEGLDCKALLP